MAWIELTVNTISPSARAVMCHEPLCMSTPIETIFPLKLILFLFTLVAMGSSSFVMGLLSGLIRPRGTSLQLKIYHGLYHSMAAIAPPAPDVRYSSAKASLLGLTRDLAVGLAPHNIRVNAILPGPIFTEMWESLIPSGTNKDDFLAEKGKTGPMQRVGIPEDVAGVAMFLASGLSGYREGDRILVGGGAPLRMRYDLAGGQNTG